MTSFQSKAYLVPGLVNDVVLEIFLHFIAVDSDGPFTLILVCSDWRDVVISNARMWTWIVFDDLKPDWSTRAHVAAALSRDLPVQLVLRTPSHDIGGLLDTIPRCSVVFLDTSAWSSILSQASSMITHEEFIDNRDQYQELHTLVANTLVALNRRGIETFVESTNNMCYSYTTWSTYERVVKAKTLKDQLADIPLHLIHTLIFEDKPKRTPRRIRLLNIWPYLPSLPYLRWLEISDNFIGGDNPSTVPVISLPSLRNLSIDCATGWHFRTKGHAFDLFSLLGRMHSPELRSLTINGSLYQLFGAVGMVNDGVRPSSLTLSFLSIEGVDPPMPRQAPILTQLQQFTLDFLDAAWSSIINNWEYPMFGRLLQELQILVKFVSVGCTIVFRGGEELQRMIPLDMPTIQCFDIVYGAGDHYLESLPWLSTTSQFGSLTITAGSPQSRTYIPWFQSAQRVILEAVDLDSLLQHAWTDYTAMSVLDAGISTMDSHRAPHLCSFTSDYPRRFRHITRLRMTAEVLKVFIEHFEMRSLQEITLCEDKSGDMGPFEGLLNAMFKREDRLLRLGTLHLEVFPPWERLIRFVATFNRPLHEGVSCVILPGLPNPPMLRALVEALKNTSDHYMAPVPCNDVPAALGCSACVGGGWTCYAGVDCRRFSPDTIVSITKDTYIAKYGLG